MLREHGAILAVIAAFIVAKIPNLTMPYWWDEAGAYIPPSHIVASKGLWLALPGTHAKGLLAGHPPILYLLHGGLYQIFGDAIFPHRLAALAFAVLGLWFTYRLGGLLSTRSTGVCAALLLACSSMFFAQSSMVLGDMPIASLGVMSVYYLLAGKWRAYAVTATLLLQTKETALVIPVAAALYHCFFPPEKLSRLARFLIHAIPIGSLVAFFAVEYLATGTFVQASYFDTQPLFMFDVGDPIGAVLSIFGNARWVARMLFVWEGRFIMTGLLVLGVVYWRKFWRREFTLFALVIAFYWAAFSLIGFLPRYVMPALPFLCLAAAWSVYVVFWQLTVAQYVIVGSLAFFFVTFFYRASASGNFETNMEHQAAVAVCARLGNYVEEKFPNAKIVADWPITAYFLMPELGYVKSRKQIIGTENLNPNERIPADVFVYFSLTPSPLSDALLARAGPPLRRFEQSGIFAAVYELKK